MSVKEGQLAEFPKVHARLRRRRRIPGTVEVNSIMEIWTAGSRFRIRDRGGRPAREILLDVSEPHGFGYFPRTIEEFMDEASAATRPERQATEVTGDLAAGWAQVDEPGTGQRPVSVVQFCLVAEQLFVPLGNRSWQRVGSGERLDRPTDLYESEATGAVDGVPYRSIFTWEVAGSYVLSRHVRDSENPGTFLEVDVLDLEEGNVTGPTQAGAWSG